MALAAAVAFEAPRHGIRASAVVVDHGLQPGSAKVAKRTSRWLTAHGLPAHVVPVTVKSHGEGLEAAARTARYGALTQAARDIGARSVLLGHTRDDQAEQVLLGLVRGSGARSLSGMPPTRDRFVRPLLSVGRERTRESCRAERVPWWDDPMNDDPAHLRVRVRQALVDLETDLGPGVVAALARTADQLRADADALDALADEAMARWRRSAVSEEPGWECEAATLQALPPALRTRVWRRVLVAAGAPAGQVSAQHADACDTLLTNWRGQGPLHLPGNLRAWRTGALVHVGRAAGHR